MRRVWQDEINSHLLDCAEDQGITLPEARKRFGDVETIGHQLSVIHPWLAAYADWIIIGVVLFACLPLYIGSTILANTIPGLIAERLLVWWWGVAIALGSFVLLKWQYHIITHQSKPLIFYALGTGFIISVIMTVILDINNFETAIYNSIVVIVASVTLWLRWFSLKLRQRTTLLYGIIGLVIFFAWREQGWLELFIFPHCLYLQPDFITAAPSQCVQLSWFHPLLFIVYSLVIISFVFT
ncbi:MAG: hypothetical protein UY81_C0059G0001, partial [Candidatus Giovannonibacteria bacterium GW2011_GWA2_53_7]